MNYEKQLETCIKSRERVAAAQAAHKTLAALNDPRHAADVSRLKIEATQ